MIKDLIQAIIEGKDYREQFDKEFGGVINTKLSELKSSVYSKLFEAKYAEEGSVQLARAEMPDGKGGKIIKLVRRKMKVESIDIEQEETLDEGIVTGSSSKVFHKKVGPAKYTLHITDLTGKEHKIYSVEDKDGSDSSAKKAADAMGRALANKYGVKHWNESEETVEYDDTIEETLDSLLKE